MDSVTILTFIACICFIFIIGKLFIVPLKYLTKLAINSILGGLIIFLINFFAQGLDFHIGLNLFTSIFVGLLGIPRCYYINIYSTVTDLAKFLGLSTSNFFSLAT